MFTNIYNLYDTHNLIKSVRTIVEFSGDKNLLNLLEKVKCNVQDELGEGLIEEMDRIRNLPSEELLERFLDLYCALHIYPRLCS